MQPNQFLENAKTYAIPGKQQVIFNFIGHIILYCLCVALLIVIYWAWGSSKDDISIPLNLFTRYLFLIVIISTLISGIHNYFLYFRKGRSEKLQKEYLMMLRTKTTKEIRKSAENLMLLRTVPEIGNSIGTDQKHIDDIQAGTKKLLEIEEALKQIG